MSVADELEKLAALRDSGVLTEVEFQQQKARAMSSEPGPDESEDRTYKTPKKGGSYFPVMGIAMALLAGVFLIVAVLSD